MQAGPTLQPAVVVSYRGKTARATENTVRHKSTQAYTQKQQKKNKGLRIAQIEQKPVAQCVDHFAGEPKVLAPHRLAARVLLLFITIAFLAIRQLHGVVVAIRCSHAVAVAVLQSQTRCRRARSCGLAAFAFLAVIARRKWRIHPVF